MLCNGRLREGNRRHFNSGNALKYGKKVAGKTIKKGIIGKEE